MILREEEDFLVCLKEAGLDFHNSQEGPGFFTRIKELRALSHPGETLYPLHRLDKLTSGLILVARNKKAAAGMGALIAGGGVEKTYLAVSDKKPLKKQGWVVGDMERSRRGQWILKRTKENPARTYFFSRSLEPGYRLFLVRIYTGKTHQVRVALKSLGSPILGDPLYYGSGPVAERCYLHAWRLKFSWKDQNFDLESLPRGGRLFDGLKGRDRLLDLPSFPVYP